MPEREIDLAYIFPGASKNDGIWKGERVSTISYPTTANAQCNEIEDESFWFEHRSKCIVSLVTKYSPNACFMDVGGGNGFICEKLEKEKIKTILLEPGIDGVLQAKKRGIEHLVWGSIVDLPYTPQSIDAIGLFDVIEHIENDHEVLSILHNILVNDGFLYLSVPAYSSLWSQADHKAGHYRRYNKKEMNLLLRENGFEIVFSTYIFTPLPLPIFLFKSIPFRLNLKKKNKRMKYEKRIHRKQPGIIGKILKRILTFEINKLKKGKSLLFGSSFLAVVKKITK
jgi:SAM-dependent methyltransferase